MYTHKLIIELKEPTLFMGLETPPGSDAMPMFGSDGFPMVPGKTIKGLWSDAMEEYLEWNTHNSSEIKNEIEKYFGVPGRLTAESGKILVDNARISVDIKNKYLGKPNDFFLIEQASTAINETTEIAEEGSLRNYFYLNPAIVPHLEAYITLAEDIDCELIKKSLRFIRYGGGQRNRGHGLLKCTLEKFELEPFLEIEFDCNSNDAIAIEIENLEPLVLTDSVAVDFFTETEEWISGPKIQGLLFAHAQKNKSKVDEIFNGKINISALILKNSQIIPQNIRYSKYSPTEDIGDVFTSNIISAKPYSGYYNADLNKIDIPKTVFMHSSRPNRAAGRAFEGDGNGDIFQIEALQEGLVFEGTITGVGIAALYDKIKDLKFGRLGSKKYGQYGAVKINVKPIKLVEAICAEACYLMFTTPYISETNDFKADISKYFENNEIAKVFYRESIVNGFRTDWGSRDFSCGAIAAGSVVLFKNSLRNINKQGLIGLKTHQGYGAYTFYSKSEIEELIIKLKQISLENKQLPSELKTANSDPYDLAYAYYNEFLNQSLTPENYKKFKNLSSSNIGNFALIASQSDNYKQFEEKINKHKLKDILPSDFKIEIGENDSFSDFMPKYLKALRKLKNKLEE